MNDARRGPGWEIRQRGFWEEEGLYFGREEHISDRVSHTQGKLYVRGDSKVFRFQNGKSESLFLQRKNPRRIAWTVLYRRQHRKGISEVRSTFRSVTHTSGSDEEGDSFGGGGRSMMTTWELGDTIPC